MDKESIYRLVQAGDADTIASSRQRFGFCRN